MPFESERPVERLDTRPAFHSLTVIAASGCTVRRGYNVLDSKFKDDKFPFQIADGGLEPSERASEGRDLSRSKGIVQSRKHAIMHAMKTIVIMNQKGGAGKTTLAVHIATAAYRAGYPAAILDMDQQGTAEAWHGWREKTAGEKEPAVFPAKIPTLESWLKRVKDAGAALTVIDTAPLAQGEAIAAAKVSDLILSPCRPASFDLHAIKLTADLASHTGKPAFAIFNGGPPRKATIYDDSAKVLASYGLDLAPVRLSERVVFKQAVGSGQTAQEIEPEGKAAAEVAALWSWLQQVLKI
jgi:chromosome partitioning protein